MEERTKPTMGSTSNDTCDLSPNTRIPMDTKPYMTDQEPKLEHLYIGLTPGEQKLYPKDTRAGFEKIIDGENKDSIFTRAFIAQDDAKKWYGPGNYRKIEITY